jgi:hypothetical protein
MTATLLLLDVPTGQSTTDKASAISSAQSKDDWHGRSRAADREWEILEMSSLLSRLFALVAAAMLPAIAIQAYNEIDLRRTRQVEVQDEALGLPSSPPPSSSRSSRAFVRL